ncbi:MAG: hypothetical protein WC944_08020, partial [Candidatus Cloacimonadaceae bacterium]
ALRKEEGFVLSRRDACWIGCVSHPASPLALRKEEGFVLSRRDACWIGCVSHPASPLALRKEEGFVLSRRDACYPAFPNRSSEFQQPRIGVRSSRIFPKIITAETFGIPPKYRVALLIMNLMIVS